MARNLRFLIADDEFISRTLLKEILNAYGDCHVVENGNDALDVLRKSFEEPSIRYDVVCLDIMMPERNGLEVLKELRRLEKSHGIDGAAKTKVLMITSLDDSKNILEALVLGSCEAYLTKPISRIKLEKQLRSLRLIEPIC